MTKPEPTLVVLRRARVPDDRKPHRVLPGDYFAVIVNAEARPGNLPAVASYYDHSMAPGFCEVSLSYYQASRPARLEEAPPDLIRYLAETEGEEGAAPIVYRKRIRHEEKQEMWRI